MGSLGPLNAGGRDAIDVKALFYFNNIAKLILINKKLQKIF